MKPEQLEFRNDANRPKGLCRYCKWFGKTKCPNRHAYELGRAMTILRCKEYQDEYVKPSA